MNETDFIRQQLALERAHLREILNAVDRDMRPADAPAALATYLDWAGERLLARLKALRAALQALPTPPAAELAALAAACDAAGPAGPQRLATASASQLTALLNAWNEPLDALAGHSLRIAHWRVAAKLSADTIFEERQRHAAARAAVSS